MLVLIETASVRTTHAGDEYVSTTAKGVGRAARHSLFPVTCLTRSLVLKLLLRRRGVHAQLRIGTRILSGKLEAHAWIEHEGLVINDTPEVIDGFAAFASPLLARAAPKR